MRDLTLAFIALVALQAGAHGEDRLGPHGGFVSMPGAFHVELVPEGKRKLKVYLLDVDWKNPTLKESSVELVLASVFAKCTGRTDHFICEFPAAVDLSKPGELKVDATREKQRGNTAKYSLPLKIKMNH